MDLFLGLVLLLPFLTLVIAVHEAGHFYFARRFGMKVHEYFIGFGPWKIWSRRKGELEYGVKALLGGGYVKIAGMNPYEVVPEEDVPRAYYSKPAWQRAIVILVGPLSHFLVAGLMFAGLLAVVGDGETKALVGAVDQTLADGSVSPAAKAGLQPGDVVVRAGDVVDPNQDEFGAAIRTSVGQPMTFTILRGEERFDVTMTPRLDCVGGTWEGAPDSARCVGGTEAPRTGVVLHPSPRPIHEAAVLGFREVYVAGREALGSLGDVFGPDGVSRVFKLLFTDAQREPTDPSSVVGIGQTVGSYGGQGEWSTIIYFLAYITVFVGLVNLLPLPPFDGGHVLLLVIEAIRGKAVDMRRVIPVAVTVMGLLITFFVATVVADITKPPVVAP